MNATLFYPAMFFSNAWNLALVCSKLQCALICQENCSVSRVPKLTLSHVRILTGQPLIHKWSTSLHPKTLNLGLLPVQQQKML